MSPQSALLDLQAVFAQHGIKGALRFLLSLPEEVRRELTVSVGLDPDDIERQVKELEDDYGGT